MTFRVKIQQSIKFHIKCWNPSENLHILNINIERIPVIFKIVWLGVKLLLHPSHSAIGIRIKIVKILGCPNLLRPNNRFISYTLTCQSKVIYCWNNAHKLSKWIHSAQAGLTQDKALQHQHPRGASISLLLFPILCLLFHLQLVFRPIDITFPSHLPH